ncbi:MAG: aminopeptidase P family protein [Pseudomonadota bacterium]|nr:aminopeptidase P family protein [Pseudomonadota bacterium]
MNEDPPVYLGDNRLNELLDAHGLSQSVADVRDLIEGVLAAPPSLYADQWLILLGRSITPDLKGQLVALKTEITAKKARQNDEEPDYDARLEALRVWMDQKSLDGFLVPRADEHQGEYVPAYAERLKWLTGFTGSAGSAVILKDRAAIFVDGRYVIQVRHEVDLDLYEPVQIHDMPLHDWLTDNMTGDMRLGYDPWLHTPAQIDRIRAATDQVGAVLVPCVDNPVDTLWTDRPRAPITPVMPHNVRFTGRRNEDKFIEIGQSLAIKGLKAAILTRPDSIAWLLNVRGGDVPFTPVPLCYAIIDDTGTVRLFIDARKLIRGVTDHMGARVQIEPFEALPTMLDALGQDKRIGIDPTSAPSWIADRLTDAGAIVVHETDPCVLPKACKTATEIAGMLTAHEKDGVALVRFLAWLAENAPNGKVDELDASARILKLRREGDLFAGPSFETISASGPHGAIVHYKVTPESNRKLCPGELYLIDSGGQYLDGTTDVTRTIAIGTPSDEMRRSFTLVLKGHIALMQARFPVGTTGGQLDMLGRKALWDHGLDYDHGTGHGVGSYLMVHEEPQKIAARGPSVALATGMVLSNEPGYYREGAFGIRIESLMAVREAKSIQGGERNMLCFETLTLAPVDLALVDPKWMTANEIQWLNAYHQRVRSMISPRLNASDAAWLARATMPVQV